MRISIFLLCNIYTHTESVFVCYYHSFPIHVEGKMICQVCKPLLDFKCIDFKCY